MSSELKKRGSLKLIGVSGAVEGKEEGGVVWFAVVPAERQLGSCRKSMYYSSKLRFCSLWSLHAKSSSPTRCKGAAVSQTAGGALLLRLDF